jgi:hypothetical protein
MRIFGRALGQLDHLRLHAKKRSTNREFQALRRAEGTYRSAFASRQSTSRESTGARLRLHFTLCPFEIYPSAVFDSAGSCIRSSFVLVAEFATMTLTAAHRATKDVIGDDKFMQRVDLRYTPRPMRSFEGVLCETCTRSACRVRNCCRRTKRNTCQP